MKLGAHACAALLVAVAASPAHAAPHLTLTAPAHLAGDGTSVATLRLTSTTPLGNTAPTARTDAGRIRSIKHASDGAWEIELVAPRVASPLAAHVTVSAPVAHGRASAAITVDAAPFDAGEVRSSGPLALRGPARVLLGRDTQALVHLHAPAATANVHLLASEGTLGALEPDGAGGARVTWSLPGGRPRVAIVAAVDETAHTLDWIPVVLYGMPLTQVKSEATVIVRVAGVEYGPVRTDARGATALKLAVPPSARTAEVEAVDDLGNTTRSPLDLGLPPYQPVHLLCPARSDEESPTVRVFTVDARGAPTSVPVQLAASSGQVSALEAAGPGVATAHLTVDERTPERVTVTADPGAQACTIALPKGAPTALALRVAIDTHAAGAGPVEVVAEVRYRGGRGDAAPELTVDAGTIDPPHAVGGGRFVTEWHLPDRLPPQPLAHVRARLGPSLHAEAAIALKPGPLARIEIAARPAALRGDGHSRAEVHVSPRDAFGNPVPAPRLREEAEGDVHEAHSDDTTATDRHLTYVAPHTYARRDDEIVVRDDDTRVQAALRMPLLPSRFHAGVGLGLVTNFAKVTGVLVDGDARWRLPWLRSSLSLGLKLGYYRSSQTDTLGAGVETETFTLSAVPILAHVYYHVPVEKMGLYVAAGGGLVIAWTDVTSAATGDVGATTAVPAASVLAGGAVALGPGRVAVEVGWWYAALQDNPRGNIGGLKATAGYGVEF